MLTYFSISLTGLILAVLIGVAIGIVVGFTLLATVLWCRRYVHVMTESCCLENVMI